MSKPTLYIPGSKETPDILFEDGFMKIRGRALRTDMNKVPDVLWEWIDSYVQGPAEITRVTLAFEIMNSVSAAMLMIILRKVLTIAATKKVVICWYYENDDHDMLERGEHFSAALGYPFSFIETGNLQAV